MQKRPASRKPLLLAFALFLAQFSLISPASAAPCTNTTTSQSGFRFYAFTSFTSCQFTIPVGVTQIDYLVVAGGGGGGSRAGGGGGGGGYKSSTGVSVSGISSLTVTVGDGGAGGPASRSGGTVGSNSVLVIGGLTETATGGGGGHDSGYAATTGGASSGGGTGNVTRLALSVSGQGNLGGAGTQNCGSNDWCGGGGGGAGFPGGSASTTTSGAGGDGITVSWISSIVATALGVSDTSTGSAYFAGGGSGGRGAAGTSLIGAAGNGGGGLGTVGCSSSSCTPGASGKNFTGGGGGGGGYQFSPTDYSGGGGKGGSGVIILRMIIPSPTLSSSISSAPTYRKSSVITANSNVAGRVTFLANGKRIPGCISLLANLSAQCNWMPTLHGTVLLTQTFVPTDAIYSNTSSALSALSVLKRTNTR